MLLVISSRLAWRLRVLLLLVPGSEHSFRTWSRLLFHHRTLWGHVPHGIDDHHNGGTESTPWGVLGIVVTIFTFPGIIAPLVTGLIIQSAG